MLTYDRMHCIAAYGALCKECKCDDKVYTSDLALLHSASTESIVILIPKILVTKFN